MIKEHHDAVGEPRLQEDADSLIKDWDALMKWHRSRTLEGLARVELHRAGKLDPESQYRYLLRIERSIADEAKLT